MAKCGSWITEYTSPRFLTVSAGDIDQVRPRNPVRWSRKERTSFGRAKTSARLLGTLLRSAPPRARFEPNVAVDYCSFRIRLD
jgi:hypothetical protein